MSFFSKAKQKIKDTYYWSKANPIYSLGILAGIAAIGFLTAGVFLYPLVATIGFYLSGFGGSIGGWLIGRQLFKNSSPGVRIAACLGGAIIGAVVATLYAPIGLVFGIALAGAVVGGIVAAAAGLLKSLWQTCRPAPARREENDYWVALAIQIAPEQAPAPAPAYQGAGIRAGDNPPGPDHNPAPAVPGPQAPPAPSAPPEPVAAPSPSAASLPPAPAPLNSANIHRRLDTKPNESDKSRTVRNLRADALEAAAKRVSSVRPAQFQPAPAAAPHREEESVSRSPRHKS